MSTLTPLLPAAIPALLGGGCTTWAVEGRTWYWPFSLTDPATGALIDVSTGVTGTCEIWDAATATLVVTLTVVLGNGSLSVGLAKAATVNLAGGKKNGRLCKWGFKLDDGTTSIECWMPFNSEITIYDEAAVL